MAQNLPNTLPNTGGQKSACSYGVFCSRTLPNGKPKRRFITRAYGVQTGEQNAEHFGDTLPVFVRGRSLRTP